VSFWSRIFVLNAAGYQKSHKNPGSASLAGVGAVPALPWTNVRTASLISNFIPGIVV